MVPIPVTSTPAPMLARSTRSQANRNSPLRSHVRDIFIYLWHDFFQVGWLHSKAVPKVSSPGDLWCHLPFCVPHPARSEPGSVSLRVLLHSSLLLPQASFLTPLLVSQEQLHTSPALQPVCLPIPSA